MTANTNKSDAMKILRAADPVAVVKARVDESADRLLKHTTLLNALYALAQGHPQAFADGEFQRAVQAASENFGVEASIYADLTDELNFTCDDDTLIE